MAAHVRKNLLFYPPPCRLLIPLLVNAPVNLQLIGQELAIAWDDGSESYIACEKLRALSPSASNLGERDIFGTKYGGDGPKNFAGVTITGWQQVGNYAIRFEFSDGHGSGLYAYDYLRKISTT